MKSDFIVRELNFIDGLNFLKGISALDLPPMHEPPNILSVMQHASRVAPRSCRREIAGLLAILFGVSVDFIAVALSPGDVLEQLNNASIANPVIDGVLAAMFASEEIDNVR